MPSVCFYFQVHQPFRIKHYSVFDIGKDHFYEDGEKNKWIMDKVSEKCYLPANKKMLELIKRHKGKFRISYSLSGTVIEQMMRSTAFGKSSAVYGQISKNVPFVRKSG